MKREIDSTLYRVYYVKDNDTTSFDPRNLPPWPIIADHPRGRWDDVIDDYRVLYTASEARTAYVEVLADLRPNGARIREIAAVADDEEGEASSDASAFAAALATAGRVALEAAVRRLQERYFARLAVVPGHYAFDVGSGGARTLIESELGGDALKVGDFIARGHVFTRRVSRLVFNRRDELGVVAIAANSAEDHDGHVTALFEDPDRPNALLVGAALTVEKIERAWPGEALAYLGILQPRPEDIATERADTPM